jgi:2-polyprenyl-3-methyl-5-hydroxy-6-metoxy-1,4-benzoquinol methylase
MGKDGFRILALAGKKTIRDADEYGDYEGVRGELYAADHPKANSGEYEWLKAIAAQEGDPICELACGHGRLSIPSARLGHKIVGMDRSAKLVELANQALFQESESVQARASFVKGDLRQFDLQQKFQYIFIFFGGFYCLEKPQERMACIQCVSKHLLPGGLLEIEDPNVGPKSVPRTEMENLFKKAELKLESALRAHKLPLENAEPKEPALLYRVRK